MKHLSFLFIFLLIICCSEKNIDSPKILSTNENWINYSSKNSIPKPLLEVLKKLNGEEFKIADPNEKFEASDDITDNSLPRRKLVILAKKNNKWRIGYLQGGVGISYIYVECKISKDSIFEIKKGHSFSELNNNDTIDKRIKTAKMKLQDIKIVYQ